MTNVLKTHFKTLLEAEQYLVSERFERVFDGLFWLSDDGLINAEIMGGHTCYIVEYVA